MLRESVFRSKQFPVPDRFDAWRECMSRTHAPVDFISDFAADYYAHSRVIELGAVSVYPTTFQQTIWSRTPELVRRSDPETMNLTLLLRGEARASWERHENSYTPYDFHTNDSSRPYEIWTSSGLTTFIGVEIPRTVLPLPGNATSRVIGKRLAGREGIGVLVAQFLTQIVKDSGHYRPSDGPRLGSTLVDLMATLFANALEAERCLPPETRTHTLTLRIKAFIRQHLNDPALAPGQVAAAHHISLSYLHRVFQQAGLDTVAAYIRRQRLEGARADLADPGQRATPVHVVAARWGFPEAAHFSRAFRHAYGVSPKEHRHNVLGAQA